MHLPVLLEEATTHLITDPNGVYIDATVGGGGHLARILNTTDQDALIVGLDKDREVLEQTRTLFDWDKRVSLLHGDFKDIATILEGIGINAVDGILLDLGVSSFQLDEKQRGFSYHDEAWLDMRMNQLQELSAWNVVNEYPEKELSRIFRVYGEEQHAGSIARTVVKRRLDHSIDTTIQLTEIIQSVVPAAYRRKKHPARKAFQAIRIEVNQELANLDKVLPQAVNLLKTSGRLCIITFHSLEDRIVKRFMQEECRSCLCPVDFPVCVCGHRARLSMITKKPILPAAEEVAENPRARSAKLRVAVKL